MVSQRKHERHISTPLFGISGKTGLIDLFLEMPDSPKPTTSTNDDVRSLVPSKRSSEKRIVLRSENCVVKVVKKPRIVLEEDDFTNELEKIIVRDYFPELPRLKVGFKRFNVVLIVNFQAQKAYTDAIACNDIEKIRELQIRYSSNFTNGAESKTIRKFNLNAGRFDVDTDLEEVVVNPEGQNEKVCL